MTNTAKQRLLPGVRYSVELDRCGHRACVDARAKGWLPRRAHCPTCHRWRNVRPETARRPIRQGSRTIIGERFEERDGRVFTVKVLETPRRARL
jgi:hypothetical protein